MLIIVAGQEAKLGYLFDFHRKVCCVFSLESPHLGDLGDSNEYTQYTIFSTKKKIILNYPKSKPMGFFPRDSRMSSKKQW